MGVQCNLVFDHPDLKIINIVSSSFCWSELCTADWKTNVVWLITPWWSLLKDSKCVRRIADAASSLPDNQRICVLANEPAEAELVSSIPNVDSAYLNHNTFISPRVFDVTETEKIYDAVINSRPLLFKRVHLCAGVENLCCIRHTLGLKYDAGPDFFDAATLSPSFLNYESLHARQVAELLNKSWCGVILSAWEGACYASTEYLYCGLPVVSTSSLGGRHVWYNDYNSIIVEPSQNAVSEAVASLKKKRLEGTVRPDKIRSDALKLRDLFIETGKDMIAGYLEEFQLPATLSAQVIMQRWLAEIELGKRQFKYFSTEPDAFEYFNSGNLWFWRNTVRNFGSKEN